MLELESVAMIDEKKEALKSLLPEIFTDGKIDPDALKALFGEEVESEKEKYRFTWNGKRDLFSLINKRSSGTLKPDITKSLGFDTAQNTIIEGDNLEVLKLLGSAYHRRVKMIYIDPPYNKQKDFVYPDNWSDPLESYLMQTGQKDEFGLTSSYQDKTGRLHTNWLNMIYPRLYLARNLLRDDGVIFVSIDDDEVHNLRKVMDEIFGDENFVEQLVWKRRTTPPNDRVIGRNHEYILCYAKNSELLKIYLQPRSEDINSAYKNSDNDPNGLWTASDLSANGKGDRLAQSCIFPIINPLTKEAYLPPKNKCWLYNKEKIDAYIKEGRIGFRENSGTPFLKRYLSEVRQGKTLATIIDDGGTSQDSAKEFQELFKYDAFEFPKPTKLMKKLISCGSVKDDIILDFFAGSGTTAHAVMALNAEEKIQARSNNEDPDEVGNRRYILVQIPETLPENSEARKLKFETIADITAERVRRAAKNIGDTSGFRYFRLDRSHFRVFDQIKYEKGKSPEEVLKLLRLSMFVDNTMMSGWTKVGVAFETALKNGLGLSSTYTVEKNGNYTLHSVEEGGRIFTFCFDDVVKEDIAKLLLAGSKFVCFDKALTDSVKLNIAAQIGTENIETI